jgi:Family of unknown function (DUF5984)
MPWGQEPNLSLSWFALTDGDLWLRFGNETIYEYSIEAQKHFGDKPTLYNDYYLSRFIEDFTYLFEKIRETLPETCYQLTSNLKQFKGDAIKWLDIYDTGENEYSDFYFDEYDKLISWTSQRSFDSGHLIGGPQLSFFRRNDKIRIVWDTEYNLENGVNLWAAKDGSYEMNYSDFMERIKEFGEKFFQEMENQIKLVVAKDWGSTKLDKKRIVEEQEERKNEFLSKLSLLRQESTEKTDWKEIELLCNRMINEIE